MNQTFVRLVLASLLSLCAGDIHARGGHGTVFYSSGGSPIDPSYYASEAIMAPPPGVALMRPNEGVLFGSLGYLETSSVYEKDKNTIANTAIKLVLTRIDAEGPQQSFSMRVQPDEYKASTENFAVPSLSRHSGRQYRALFYRSLPAGTYRITDLACRIKSATGMWDCAKYELPDATFQVVPGKINYIGATVLDISFENRPPSERLGFFKREETWSTYEYLDDFNDDLHHLHHVRKDSRAIEALDAAAAAGVQ